MIDGGQTDYAIVVTDVAIPCLRQPSQSPKRVGWALPGLRARRQGVGVGYFPVEARSLARTPFPVALNFLNHDRRL